MAGPQSALSVADWRGLLRNRRFVLYLASLSAGDIGYAVYAVAAPWLAYQVTGNFLDVGAVLAAEFGLYAFSFVAAPVVDRTAEKRKVLVIGYALQAIAATVIGVLALAHRLDLPLLLGLVSAISLVWDFTWSTNNAIPPLLLSKEALFRANGLSGLVSGGNQVTGFTVGGALILLTGPGGAMVLYGGLNVLALLLSLGISTRGSPMAKGTTLEALREGWRSWWSEAYDRPLRSLSLLVAVQGFLAPGAVLLITELASRSLDGAQFTYGVIFTAFVLGGAAVGIALGQLDPRRSVGLLLVVSPVVSAGLLALTPWVASSLLDSTLLWFAIGAAMLVFEGCFMVYLQASSPPELVARSVSNVYFFRGTARAAGSLVLGAVAAMVLPGALAEVVAVGLLIVAGVGVVLWGSLRRMSF